MIKRVLPEDYFANFFPQPVKKAEDKKGVSLEDINNTINNLRKDIQEALKANQESKVIYVPQPVREVATETTNTNSTFWHLLGIIALTGIIVLGIVAIATRRKD